jgi:hypothetical protein
MNEIVLGELDPLKRDTAENVALHRDVDDVVANENELDVFVDEITPELCGRLSALGASLENTTLNSQGHGYGDGIVLELSWSAFEQ